MDHPTDGVRQPDMSDLPVELQALVQGVVDGLVLRRRNGDDVTASGPMNAAIDHLMTLRETPTGRARLERVGSTYRLGRRLQRPRTAAAFVRWAGRP